MKRSLSFLLLAALAGLLLFSNSASAQCPSTTPDCPGTPWIFGGSVTLKIPKPGTTDTCTVEVAYCYRNGCGYYDYYFKEMAYTNCMSGSYSQATILQMIRDAFIANNPENFPCAYPQEPATIWRFITSACYYDDTTSDPGKTIVRSCGTETAWCWRSYTTGCDINGHTYIISQSSGTVGTASCTSPCYDVCNLLP